MSHFRIALHFSISVTSSMASLIHLWISLPHRILLYWTAIYFPRVLTFDLIFSLQSFIASFIFILYGNPSDIWRQPISVQPNILHPFLFATLAYLVMSLAFENHLISHLKRSLGAPARERRLGRSRVAIAGLDTHSSLTSAQCVPYSEVGIQEWMLRCFPWDSQSGRGIFMTDDNYVHN